MRRPARIVQELAHRLGVEITRYTPRNFGRLRRRELLRSGAIDLLVDVGAADGAWAAQARTLGYAGAIVSFEPRVDAFGTLQARADADGAWRCECVAVGAAAGRATLLLDGQSSTLGHGAGAVEVRVAPLDELLEESSARRAYLKIDVEGHELDVLRGASALLRRCAAVEIETAFTPRRSGQAPAHEAIALLWEHGFGVVAIDSRGADDAGLVDANVFFERAQPAPASSSR
jgi:FkbM family methyltransferase